MLEYLGIDPNTIDPGTDFLVDRGVTAKDMVIPNFSSRTEIHVTNVQKIDIGQHLFGAESGRNPPYFITPNGLRRHGWKQIPAGWLVESSQPLTSDQSAITTHDLPTVAGLWTGSDLEAQRRLKMAPNEAATEEIRGRIAEMTKATAATPVATVIARLHAALATAPSRLLTATLEERSPSGAPNMPATTHQWPNWSIPCRRRSRS